MPPHTKTASAGDALLPAARESHEVDGDKAAARRKLLIAICFCFVFMCAEVFGGYIANSLAIMTDAAHLLSDVAGLCINVFALWLSSKPPTVNMTFGYHRAEVLGALVSVLIIWLLTGVLVYEAIQRVIHPVRVKGEIMFIIACCGFAVNVALMKVLHQGHGHSHAGGGHGHSHGGGHGHSHGGGHGHGHGSKDGGDEEKGGWCCGCLGGGGNIGVRAAFIHAVGDLVQSIGVMIAGGLIWYNPDWHLADPLCTFLFSILVLTTTVQIMNHGVRTLLDSVPDHVRHTELLDDLEALEGVLEAHDLHVWSVGSGKALLSAHLTVSQNCESVLRQAQLVCRKHGVMHTTIQLEVEGTTDIEHCIEHKPCDMRAVRRGMSASTGPRKRSPRAAYGSTMNCDNSLNGDNHDHGHGSHGSHGSHDSHGSRHSRGHDHGHGHGHDHGHGHSHGSSSHGHGHSHDSNGHDNSGHGHSHGH